MFGANCNAGVSISQVHERQQVYFFRNFFPVGRGAFTRVFFKNAGKMALAGEAGDAVCCEAMPGKPFSRFIF